MARAEDLPIIEEFRANRGIVAAPYENPPPMMLVHTQGRRSGRAHITPMRCLPENDHWYVFASAHGGDRHPDWYWNLVANPDIAIELGTETIPVHATVLEGAERDRVFSIQSSRFSTFAGMQARLARQIPVIRLTRRQS